MGPDLSAPATPPSEPIRVAPEDELPEPNGAETASAESTNPTTKEDLTKKISKNTEQAKNVLFQAIFENNREAQIELVQRYVLPVVSIIVVMFAANWLGNRLKERVSTFVSRRVDLTLGRFSGTLTKAGVIIMALFAVLTVYEIELTSFAALIAAIGFAIGMALQGTLGNFASGIALLTFRPFNVGDFIIIDDSKGTVQSIGLFTTSLDTPDNRRIILPNESVFGNRIENLSHNPHRRVEVVVGVAYSADMQRTRQVLHEAMTSIQGAIPTPPPEVYLSELNASSVDWACRVWCRPSDFMAVKERVTETVKETLDRHSIGIPFPQLDLHVVGQGKAAPPSQQRRPAA